jgi:chromate reductase
MGSLGTALAQYDLKKILLYLNARVMGQPEFYLNSAGKFDEQGNLTDEKTKEHIKRLLEAFSKLI